MPERLGLPHPARVRVDTPLLPARRRTSPPSPAGGATGSPSCWASLAAAALPPFDLAPVLVIAFAGLIWLDDGSAGPGASFRLGWGFGFGFFLAGLYWIAAALFVDIGRFWWLVPFAAAGLPAGFALYTGLALFAARALARSRPVCRRHARIFAFAVAWSIAEWARGHALRACRGT